ADLSDEARLTDYGIHRYTNGICYYTCYIRHADDGDTNTNSPMEYATVRNNVYRLNVQSVSGPGGSGDIIVTVTPAQWKEEINVYPDF
uniref:Mfa1 fimbrilin C-terminal domain-containing protein n=1 Tax=Butyricimonas paravirosa TaxID=1472417 RepID=UPI00242CDDE9